MDTVTWTDEKLDALEKKVDDGFARMSSRMDVEFARNEERFRAIDERFVEVGRRFDRMEGDMKEGFARMDAKFDALNRTIIQVGGGLVGTMFLAMLTVLISRL
ncbi:MAG: hypothetical protein QM729_20250 [Solirubrobacterales bacterium]